MPRHRSRNRDTLRQLASRAVEGGPACTHGLVPTPRVSVDAKLLLLPPSTAHIHTHMHRHRHAHLCAHVCSHTRTHTHHTHTVMCTHVCTHRSHYSLQRDPCLPGTRAALGLGSESSKASVAPSVAVEICFPLSLLLPVTFSQGVIMLLSVRNTE